MAVDKAKAREDIVKEIRRRHRFSMKVVEHVGPGHFILEDVLGLRWEAKCERPELFDGPERD